LLGLVSGDEDKGFPILRQDDGGMRMVGYIGANELEHALSTTLALVCIPILIMVQASLLMRQNPGSSSTQLPLTATATTVPPRFLHLWIVVKWEIHSISASTWTRRPSLFRPTRRWSLYRNSLSSLVRDTSLLLTRMVIVGFVFQPLGYS
jgi:hypothetical protein